MANWVRCFLFWVLTWFQNWDIWISRPLRLSLVTLQKCWKHLKFRPYFIVWTPKLQRFLTSWKITWSAGFALPHFSQSQVSAPGEEGSIQLLSINLAGVLDCRMSDWRIHTCRIVVFWIVICQIVVYLQAGHRRAFPRLPRSLGSWHLTHLHRSLSSLSDLILLYVIDWHSYPQVWQASGLCLI